MEKIHKALLVTGASSDMGTATIKEVKDNYKCIIAHYFHMNDNLYALKEELGDKLMLMQADLSVEEEVCALITNIKEADIVPSHIIHFPAQQIKIQKFQKTDWSVMERGMNISIKSLILILQAFLPQMAKAKYGKIILMLSYVLEGMPPKYSADYVVTKYALLGLVKALAVEYAGGGYNDKRYITGIYQYTFCRRHA